MKSFMRHAHKTTKQGAKQKHGRAAGTRAKLDAADAMPGRRKYAGK